MKNIITASAIDPDAKMNPIAISNTTNNAIARINIPLPKQHKHLAKSPCGYFSAITNKTTRLIRTIATNIKPIKIIS